MKNTASITFAVLWLHSTCWAQSIEYEKYYVEDYAVEGQDMLYTSNDNYLLSGFARIPGQNDDTLIDFYTITVDKDGNKIKSQTYGDALDNYLKSSMELSNGNILLIGYSLDSLRQVTSTLVLTNPLGDFLWMKHFGLGGVPSESMETEDGNIVIVGSESAYPSRSAISKIDFDGNLIWEKVIGRSEENIALDVVQLESGDFMVSGWVKKDTTADEYKNAGYLMKLNNLGDVIWDKKVIIGDYDAFGDLEITHDGHVLVAGVSQSTSTNDYYRVPFLIKMDVDGTFLWRRDFNNMDPSWGAKIVQMTDGTIFLLGNSSHDNVNLWFMKLNAEGEEDYHIEAGDDWQNWVTSFNKLEGKAFGVLSNSYQYDSASNKSKRGMYLVKVSDPTILSHQEEMHSKINIWPNPARRYFSIETELELEKIRLLSVTGELVYEYNQDMPANYRIDTSNLSAGVYFVSFGTRRSGTVTKKVIVH